MGRQKGNKLNQLLQQWPSGVVATTAWLKEKGISRQLLDRYEEYNWISRAAKGVVLRAGDKATWQGVVYNLQTLQGLNVWVGGKSSAELKGYTHYIPMGKKIRIRLYSSSLNRMPKWIFELKDVAKFEFQKTKLFSEKVDTVGFTKLTFENIEIKISSPERAIMEMLDGVPSTQTFDEAAKIFEGLATMRPTILQSLLENCQSVKVKRLFLYFAEQNDYQWFSDLNTSKIDLGKGKRAIVEEGHLDSKYQILVPKGSP